jgi:Caulimovirus viroplasmin
LRLTSCPITQLPDYRRHIFDVLPNVLVIDGEDDEGLPDDVEKREQHEVELLMEQGTYKSEKAPVLRPTPDAESVPCILKPPSELTEREKEIPRYCYAAQHGLQLPLAILEHDRQYYYVVTAGRSPGIYRTWTDAESQVKGYPGAKHRRFRQAEDAHEHFEQSSLSSMAPPGEAMVAVVHGLGVNSRTQTARAAFSVVWPGNPGLDFASKVDKASMAYIVFLIDFEGP